MDKEMTKKEARRIVKRAIKLLEPVPEEEWLTSVFSNGYKCCVIGHWMRLTSNNPENRNPDNCTDAYSISPERDLRHAFGILLPGPDLATINNNQHHIFGSTEYLQKTPKARSLAALRNALEVSA